MAENHSVHSHHLHWAKMLPALCIFHRRFSLPHYRSEIEWPLTPCQFFLCILHHRDESNDFAAICAGKLAAFLPHPPCKTLLLKKILEFPPQKCLSVHCKWQGLTVVHDSNWQMWARYRHHLNICSMQDCTTTGIHIKLVMTALICHAKWSCCTL